jgi:hypothetical protein
MEPQRQPQGQPRKIVAFHLDENLDWVAELECGHQQHVRHNPPWTHRHGSQQQKVDGHTSAISCDVWRVGESIDNALTGRMVDSYPGRKLASYR